MKYLLVILLSLFLAGCGSPLTRLLPKLEKLEVDPILMTPPKELKLIQKPSPKEVKKILEEQLRNDAQSLREVGWFNRAIMMDSAANEIQKLNERIKQMEDAGNNLLWNFCPEYTSDFTESQSDALKQWNKAKESMP